jgi:hypothetical protein
VPKEKKEKVEGEDNGEDNGEVKKRGRPKKSEVATTASQQEIQEVKAVMKIAIQKANEALEGTGVQMEDPYKKEKKSKKLKQNKVEEVELQEATVEGVAVEEVVVPVQEATVEEVAVDNRGQQTPSSARNDIDFGEEEEEDYEEFADFAEEATSTEEKKEENVKKFTHEEVDYYVDKNITLSSEEDEEGVTWHPIKLSSTHNIVGRSSGKTMEFYEDSDDDDEEDEDDEEEDEDEEDEED